jgi:hypothetical protein
LAIIRSRLWLANMADFIQLKMWQSQGKWLLDAFTTGTPIHARQAITRSQKK